MYSNQSERANEDIYDEFEMKKPLICMFYANIFQRFKGLNLLDNVYT